jgi:hypothetical protein
MDISRIRFPLITAGVGLGLGLIADLLLYGHPAGISIPVILWLGVIALLALSAIEGASLVWRNLWLILPLLFLSAMSAVRAAPLLRFLNISGSLMLALLLASVLASRPLDPRNLGEYLEALLESSLLSLVMPVPLLGRAVGSVRRRDWAGAKVARRVLLGFLIAAPFLCLFTILFSSADLIFGSYVGRLFESFNISDLIGHTLLTGLLAWLAAGGLAYALTRHPGSRRLFSVFQGRQPAAAPNGEPVPENEPDLARRRSIRNWLGTVESSIVLFSIDVLFAIFVAIQFAALFGGEAFLRRQNLTYSEYARRGFFELLAVALITLSLILALDFVTARQTRRQRVVFLAGSGLLLVMTIIILASAWERLQLYELAYGFTTLRVYSHVFMVWLAVLLAYFLIFLVLNRPHLFATGALLTALGFTITMNIMNPDAFIVRQNVARYQNGEALDVDYLGTLSADAVPLMIPLLYQHGPEIGAQVGPYLHYMLDDLDARQARAGWPSAHVAINRAYRMLNHNRDLIEQFEPAYPWRDIYSEY